MKNQDVIKAFVNHSESAHTLNVRSMGDKLFNYDTCLAQRYNGGIILNVTRYSVSTSKVQLYLKHELEGYQVTEVSGVPMGAHDLVKYIKK